MKIVHIITGLLTGGAEKALYNLLQGGLDRHFDNHIISLTTEGTMGPLIEALGVPVTTLGLRAGRPLLAGLLNLRTVIKKSRPHLIQGWMYHGNLMAMLARCFAPGHPILAWNIRHSLYDLGYEKLMMQQVIRANRLFSTVPDALIYNSNLSRKQHEKFGFTSMKGRVIPNGIDIRRFSFSSLSRMRLRSELGIPVDAQVVGHVARLHPMKNHPAFLRAATSLALRYPEIHFMLCGREVLPENMDLAQLVPASVRDRFHFLGERNDIPDLMCAMDIFCLSSAWGEGFPNVVGEAMAIGLPCVAADVGDSSVVIGDTGVVVSRQGKNALAIGIESLLVMPREECRRLGSRARNRIENNYTLDAIVGQYADMYKRLIADSGVR